VNSSDSKHETRVKHAAYEEVCDKGEDVNEGKCGNTDDEFLLLGLKL